MTVKLGVPAMLLVSESGGTVDVFDQASSVG